MRVRFRLADVFAEAPFSGNQLCVVPQPPDDLSPELMLALAQEIGFSETTFVVESRPDRYVNRIFTPVSELPSRGTRRSGPSSCWPPRDGWSPRSSR